MKQNFFHWASRGLAIVLAISFIVAVFAVVRTQLLPLPLIMVAVPVSAIIVGLLVYVLWRQRVSRGKKVAAAVFSLLIIAGSLYAAMLSNATSSFLSSIQEKDFQTIEYSIIAKKGQQTLEGEHTVALLQTDPNTAAVKEEVAKRTTPTYQDYPEIVSLSQAVRDQTAELATLQTSYYDLLKENDPEFAQQTEVLTTFTIKVAKDQAEKEADISKPFVVYISGIDTDGPISSVARSDVNILAVINPRTHKILLVNTPRDYYVQLHGTTGPRDKLTHAGIYGIDMSVQTLEDLYNTDIAYYLRINFASLTKLVDTLGGVEVYSDRAFQAGGYTFQQGYNTLDGKQALAFSRERYSLEGGDRARGENQQRVIEAIIHKLSSADTLARSQHVLGAMEGAFQTNASESTIATLIREQMDSLQRWNVESISVDGTGTQAPTYSMGSLPLYVMEPDQASIQAARQRIEQYLQ